MRSAHALLASAALAVPLLTLAPAARAAVTLTEPSRFTITHERALSGTAPSVQEAVGAIAQWWNPAHTYSGHSGNLSVEMKADGCWCEVWPGGAVAHMKVAYLGKDVVRLTGALGPLQALAVTGVLTFSLVKKESGPMLVLTYAVSGIDAAGLQRWPGPVDAVLGEAADRMAAHMNRPR